MNRFFWNPRQDVLAAAGIKPIDCWCKYCDPGSTFRCDKCNKERAFCLGQDDEHFALCDDCWFAAYGNKGGG